MKVICFEILANKWPHRGGCGLGSKKVLQCFDLHVHDTEPQNLMVRLWCVKTGCVNGFPVKQQVASCQVISVTRV